MFLKYGEEEDHYGRLTPIKSDKELYLSNYIPSLLLIIMVLCVYFLSGDGRVIAEDSDIKIIYTNTTVDSPDNLYIELGDFYDYIAELNDDFLLDLFEDIC